MSQEHAIFKPTHYIDFVPKNFHPSETDRGPICPNYALLEICYQFINPAGEINKDDFYCGETRSAYSDIGPLSGSEGMRYKAHAICSSIHKYIKGDIALLNSNIAVMDYDKLMDLVNANPIPIKQEKLFMKYNQDKSDELARRMLLKHYKKVIFNISIEEDVKHFRKLDGPEDITDKEAIRIANSFFKRLDNIVTGGIDEHNIHTGTAAKNCEQSPISQDVPYKMSATE